MIRMWRQFPSELLCSYSLLVMHLMDLHTSNIVAHTRVRVTVAGRSSGANRSRDTRSTRGSWTSRSPRGALAAGSALPLWTWEERQEENDQETKKETREEIFSGGLVLLPGGPVGPLGPWTPTPGDPFSPFSPGWPGHTHKTHRPALYSTDKLQHW